MSQHEVQNAKSSMGATRAFDSSQGRGDAKSYNRKIVTHVPPAILKCAIAKYPCLFRRQFWETLICESERLLPEGTRIRKHLAGFF